MGDASVHNRLVGLRRAGARRLSALPFFGALYSRVTGAKFARTFVPDLQALHDVLATTELDGRYWIWAGMLLGWAREGALLAHDRDADFALLRSDLPHLLAAVPKLRAAGFEPLMQFRSNDGLTTEITFVRHDAKFEFFVFDPFGQELRYFIFGWPPDHLFELEARVPLQEHVPFDFLGRTWLRPKDFESELEHIYGDWRTPRRGWNYLEDDLSVVERRTWQNTDTSWQPTTH